MKKRIPKIAEAHVISKYKTMLCTWVKCVKSIISDSKGSCCFHQILIKWNILIFIEMYFYFITITEKLMYTMNRWRALIKGAIRTMLSAYHILLLVFPLTVHPIETVFKWRPRLSVYALNICGKRILSWLGPLKEPILVDRALP